jgi:hypothetical protein
MFEGNIQFSHPASEGIGIYSKKLSRASGTADPSIRLLKGLADLPGHAFIEGEQVVDRYLHCP